MAKRRTIRIIAEVDLKLDDRLNREVLRRKTEAKKNGESLMNINKAALVREGLELLLK